MNPPIPTSPNLPRDTHSYKGWLNSDSFFKRAFSIYGYMVVASLIIMIPFYILMMIVMIFAFSQFKQISQNIPINSITATQRPVVNTVEPLLINQLSGDFNCEDLYEEIEKDIENANYCKTDSDCGVLMLGGWYVDFGCYHFINKNIGQEQFFTKMEAYKQKCSKIINDCASAPKAKCVSNKCIGPKL